MCADVRQGMTRDPERLLVPLAARMRARAREQRYEDAATARDRFQVLAAALERRQQWQTLLAAGRIWAEDATGDGAVTAGGRLLASWKQGGGTPLFSSDATEQVTTEVPGSVALQEEAQLIWRWLNRPGVRVIDSNAPLRAPAPPIPKLEMLAG